MSSTASAGMPLVISEIFSFHPERVRTPVKALSGGEQSRAILAKLFSKPANLLVLDEPTNDLDVETLELLEEILLSFEGTVLLVSHDREFMDNVVTSILVLDGVGGVEEWVGGYSHWVEHGGRLQSLEQNGEKTTAQPPPAGKKSTREQKQHSRKLTFKEKRELDDLPQGIEALESRQSELEAEIAAPAFYQQDHDISEARLQALADIVVELEMALRSLGKFIGSRWRYLSR